MLEELEADRCRGSGCPARCTGSSRSTPTTPRCARRSSGTTGARRRSASRSRQRVGRERLLELTGNRALAGFTAPKLLWLREHEPDVYGAIAHILLPKDYVRLRLCGERAIDVADASGTLLFDVAARAWSDELLEALEIPRAWLPRVLESPEVSGVTAGGVPVAAGAGDQAAGALGVGVTVQGGPASIVLGTSGVVFAALDALRRRARGARARVLPRGAGRVARDGRDAHRGRLAALAARHASAATFAELVDEAAGWEPGREGLLFAPYLAGERTPHPDPSARGAFVGLGLRHDRGALARAVLEGVAFGLRDALDLVAEIARANPPGAGRVSGGGTRSQLWLEILAAVLELPLEVTAVDEGAAYGAALLGGVAAGVWPDAASAARDCVRVTRTIEPRADWLAAYAPLRAEFRGLYPALRPFSV